jgi:hypothetical protein
MEKKIHCMSWDANKAMMNKNIFPQWSLLLKTHEKIKMLNLWVIKDVIRYPFAGTRHPSAGTGNRLRVPDVELLFLGRIELERE